MEKWSKIICARLFYFILLWCFIKHSIFELTPIRSLILILTLASGFPLMHGELLGTWWQSLSLRFLITKSLFPFKQWYIGFWHPPNGILLDSISNTQVLICVYKTCMDDFDIANVKQFQLVLINTWIENISNYIHIYCIYLLKLLSPDLVIM